MDKKQFFYIIFIVIFVVAYQYSGNYFYKGEDELVSAFNKTTFELKESQVSVWGIYNKTYMTKEDKQNALEKLAKQIPIKSPYEFSEIDEGVFQEVKLSKESKNARTSIKIVSMEKPVEENILEVENYIIMDISLTKDIDSVIHYKNIIRDILNVEGIDSHISVDIIGEKKGRVSSETRKELTDELMDSINAKKQEEFITDDIYSIYGYAPYIDEYIVSNGKKINVDVAFTFNEKEDKTILHLASPIISVGY
ncbi:MAG: YwmB family TATA-box binding protein [Eubacteriales bacterium]